MLDRLQADLKTAMLAKDTARTGVLRMALAAYKNEAVAKGCTSRLKRSFWVIVVILWL